MNHSPNAVNKYLIDPFKAGLFGFAVFFSVIVITKIVSYAAASSPIFDVTLKDVNIALVGFGLVFVYKIFKSGKKRSS